MKTHPYYKAIKTVAVALLHNGDHNLLSIAELKNRNNRFILKNEIGLAVIMAHDIIARYEQRALDRRTRFRNHVQAVREITALIKGQ